MSILHFTRLPDMNCISFINAELPCWTVLVSIPISSRGLIHIHIPMSQNVSDYIPLVHDKSEKLNFNFIRSFRPGMD
jgi:hypothetical protein